MPCIDVDYKSSADKDIRDLSTIEAARKIYGDVILNEYIPEPTYIEAGRNIRLVYVLNRPYLIVKDKKKRESSLKFIQRLGTVIGDNIMAQGDWHVDQFKTAPFVRIPESTNVRWSDNPFYFDPTSEAKRRFYPEEKYEVFLIPEFKTSGKWDIQKLAEAVLPDCPEWYDAWKARPQKKKASKPVSSFNLSSLCRQRMQDLIAYQAYLGSDDIGHREFMIYLYRLTAYQSGMDEDAALEAARKFNEGFAHPLRKIESLTKPSDYHNKFRNSTIRDRLNCPDGLHPFGGSDISRAERYERMMAGKKSSSYVMKKDALEQTYAEIMRYQADGMRQKDIAKLMEIPLPTMKRHYRTIRERAAKQIELEAV